DAVADFAGRGDRAVVLAAVGRAAVEVDPPGIAAAHRAHTRLAQRTRVHEAAALTRGAAIVGIVLLVEALVDLSVAVVVAVVADLGPAEVAVVLAAVGQVAVEIPI